MLCKYNEFKSEIFKFLSNIFLSNDYPFNYRISPNTKIRECGKIIKQFLIVEIPHNEISSITILCGLYGNSYLSFKINSISFTTQKLSDFAFYSSTNLCVRVVYVKLIYPISFIILWVFPKPPGPYIRIC